jgi:hypothetical protein
MFKLTNTELGSGAFGKVFRGEDPVHGAIAIKIVRDYADRLQLKDTKKVI